MVLVFGESVCLFCFLHQVPQVMSFTVKQYFFLNWAYMTCSAWGSVPTVLPIPGAVERQYSHATFWDGKRKNMPQFNALKQVVDWVWKCHYKFCPAKEEDHVWGPKVNDFCHQLFSKFLVRVFDPLTVGNSKKLLHIRNHKGYGHGYPFSLLRVPCVRPTDEDIQNVLNNFDEGTGFVGLSQGSAGGTPVKHPGSPKENVGETPKASPKGFKEESSGHTPKGSAHTPQKESSGHTPKGSVHTPQQESSGHTPKGSVEKSHKSKKAEKNAEKAKEGKYKKKHDKKEKMVLKKDLKKKNTELFLRTSRTSLQRKSKKCLLFTTSMGGHRCHTTIKQIIRI